MTVTLGIVSTLQLLLSAFFYRNCLNAICYCADIRKTLFYIFFRNSILGSIIVFAICLMRNLVSSFKKFFKETLINVSLAKIFEK